MQLPPFPHVCAQTGVVQLESNQPAAHAHVSGAAHAPPCAHRCAHSGWRQYGPLHPGAHAHVSGATHTARGAEEQRTSPTGARVVNVVGAGKGTNDDEGSCCEPVDVGATDGAATEGLAVDRDGGGVG